MTGRIWRTLGVGGVIASIVAVLATVLPPSGRDRQPGTHGLTLTRFNGPWPEAATSPVCRSTTNVMSDDLWMKFPASTRVVFHLCCTQNTAIFILATGCQRRTATGWETANEEPRNQICRMKAGIPQDVCVELPPEDEWRAFVRYGTEMHGPDLFRARLRDAWISRSFSNWSGKAWGGGRWSGSHEITSEELRD